MKGRKTGGRDFVKGDPRAGRPKGSKDTRPRVGSIRAVYQDFIGARGGHDKMLEAVDEGVQNPKRALGYLELGARVLDRVDDRKNGGGPTVNIIFKSSIDPSKLRAAASRALPALPSTSAQGADSQISCWRPRRQVPQRLLQRRQRPQDTAGGGDSYQPQASDLASRPRSSQRPREGQSF